MYDKATICVWGLEAILNTHRIELDWQVASWLVEQRR